MNSTYSLWQLLKDNNIEIPIIQRDYAQGRIGKEELRRNFLTYLKESLCNNKPVQLDFVYGATSHGNDITPIDGQQRLTTLWLIHWYIAYMADKIRVNEAEKDQDNEVVNRLRHFTYQTRDSSRDFCRSLSTFSTKSSNGKLVSQFIEDQCWFSTYWKQDPTIQSMLRMISGSTDKNGNSLNDGIEQIFADCDFNIVCDRLTGNACPITFYYLDLVGLKRSDDLYLKMNARGEQLTDFENFKADLTEYLTDKAEAVKNNVELSDKRYTQLVDIQNGFPIKLDRDWARLFWNGNHGDEAYMAFINRFFLNCIILEKEKTEVDSQLKYKYTGSSFEADAKQNNVYFDYFYGRSPKGYIGEFCIDDSKIGYSDFSIMKYSNGNLPIETLEFLKKTLDGYLSFLRITGLSDIKEIIKSAWGTEFLYIPEYDDNKITTNYKNDEIHQVKTISQNGRVLFYAICRFMAQVEGQGKDVLRKSFEQWMRIVWNLISDTRMRSITAMVNQLQLIDNLSSGAMNIYTFLQNVPIEEFSDNDEGSTILKERLDEERIKAQKICEGQNWEERFKKYERNDLNRGSIRFLFTGANGEPDWDLYDKKAQSFKWDEVEKPDKNHLKSLVAHCSSWDEMKAIEYDFRRVTWIKNLTNHALYAAVHHYLLQESRPFEDKNQLHCLVYKDLTNSNILSNLYYGDSIVNGCRLRDDKYNLIALFPDGAKSEIKKYVLGNKRNDTLADLIDKHGYTCSQRISNLNFFWGWDVRFSDSDGVMYLWRMEWNKNADKWLPKLYSVNEQNTIIPEDDDLIRNKLTELRKTFGIEQ